MNQIIFPSQIAVDFRETARGLGATIAFPAGATIFREGDAPDHMYIVLEGSIDVTHRGTIIESIGPGDALGVVSLLDSKPRTASAIVTQDSQTGADRPQEFPLHGRSRAAFRLVRHGGAGRPPARDQRRAERVSFSKSGASHTSPPKHSQHPATS